MGARVKRPNPNGPNVKAVKLTDEDIANILAALRYWQRNVPDRRRHVSGHFEDSIAYDDASIDALCEHINCD